MFGTYKHPKCSKQTPEMLKTISSKYPPVTMMQLVLKPINAQLKRSKIFLHG
jgi:hypothetical protein